MRYFIFILVFFGVLSSTTYACSCGTRPFEEAVELADEIFIGRVVKIESNQELFSAEHWEYWTVHLEISKKWKGTKKSKIRVVQSFNSCEFPFEFFGEYLVFATEDESFGWNGTKNYTTWLCSRSMDTIYFADWAKEDWVWDDRKRLDDIFPNPVKVSLFYNNWTIWLFLFVGLISLVVLYIRKRNAL
ncbi:hypothetical protein BH23BAC3_BH23BAC3_33080 [soil metagenome]